MQDDDPRTAAGTTGDPRVDDTIDRLGRLDSLPTDEHVAVYQDLHDELRQVLSELDSGPGGTDGNGGPGSHGGPAGPAGR